MLRYALIILKGLEKHDQKSERVISETITRRKQTTQPPWLSNQSTKRNQPKAIGNTMKNNKE